MKLMLILMGKGHHSLDRRTL